MPPLKYIIVTVFVSLGGGTIRAWSPQPCCFGRAAGMGLDGAGRRKVGTGRFERGREFKQSPVRTEPHSRSQSISMQRTLPTDTVHIRLIHGLYFSHIGPIDGPHTVHVRPIHGPYTAHIQPTGPYTVYMQPIYGPYTATYGPYTTYVNAANQA